LNASIGIPEKPIIRPMRSGDSSNTTSIVLACVPKYESNIFARPDAPKAITFLFPDNTIAVVKPQKQDVSKAIIELLGLGTAPTNNVINLSKSGGAQKTCGNNAFNRKVYIFTKPNKDINDWCNLSNISPDYMKNNGIFEIPYKPEFIAIGTWKSASQAAPQTTTQG
jgi:hypothetical protein